MKKREYEELQAKIKELQEQLDNAEVEDDNPFDVRNGEYAYYNAPKYEWSIDNYWNKERLNSFIPCKDKSIVEARQQNHKLYDMLQRKAIETGTLVTDKMWKDEDALKWLIRYDTIHKKYGTYRTHVVQDLSTVYFTTEEVAEQAITEIVEPFMRGEI